MSSLVQIAPNGPHFQYLELVGNSISSVVKRSIAISSLNSLKFISWRLCLLLLFINICYHFSRCRWSWSWATRRQLVRSPHLKASPMIGRCSYVVLRVVTSSILWTELSSISMIVSRSPKEVNLYFRYIRIYLDIYLFIYSFLYREAAMPEGDVNRRLLFSIT